MISVPPESVDRAERPALADSGYQPYDSYQAAVGDRIIFDGIAMTVWRVDGPGYFGKGQQGKRYKAGPLVRARVEPGGVGTMFDASSHENHTIITASHRHQVDEDSP